MFNVNLTLAGKRTQSIKPRAEKYFNELKRGIVKSNKLMVNGCEEGKVMRSFHS